MPSLVEDQIHVVDNEMSEGGRHLGAFDTQGEETPSQNQQEQPEDAGGDDQAQMGPFRSSKSTLPGPNQKTVAIIERGGVTVDVGIGVILSFGFPFLC